jgi:hypothetical protein
VISFAMSRNPLPLEFSESDVMLLEEVLDDGCRSSCQKLCAAMLLDVLHHQRCGAAWHFRDLAKKFCVKTGNVVEILRTHRLHGCAAALDSYPRIRARTVTSEPMLNFLRDLLSQGGPNVATRRWTLNSLANELTQAGFQCSTFSVAQAVKMVRRSTGHVDSYFSEPT